MALPRLFQGLLLSAALLLPPSAPATTPDPQNLLKRMQQSVRTFTYEGDFVYQFGDVLNAMHLVHSWQGGHEREQLTTLTGKERDIVRNLPGEENAGEALSRGRLQAPTLMTFDVERLDGIYSFKILGSDRVAARDTHVVAVLAGDEYRYGHRLYLDKETALPLRREVLDKQGKPVSQQMFTAITISPAAAAPAPQVDETNAVVDYQGPWRFEDLPKGFVMTVYTEGRTTNGNASEHFVFSDGIVRISLFIEDQSAARLDRLSSVGPVGILGAVRDGHRVTIVGEAPLMTLKQFLKGVHLDSQDGA
jgi:sigma-E factor negative regulatory protein RseB